MGTNISANIIVVANDIIIGAKADFKVKVGDSADIWLRLSS